MKKNILFLLFLALICSCTNNENELKSNKEQDNINKVIELNCKEMALNTLKKLHADSQLKPISYDLIKSTVEDYNQSIILTLPENPFTITRSEENVISELTKEQKKFFEELLSQAETGNINYYSLEKKIEKLSSDDYIFASQVLYSVKGILEGYADFNTYEEEYAISTRGFLSKFICGANTSAIGSIHGAWAGAIAGVYGGASVGGPVGVVVGVVVGSAVGAIFC